MRSHSNRADPPSPRRSLPRSGWVRHHGRGCRFPLEGPWPPHRVGFLQCVLNSALPPQAASNRYGKQPQRLLLLPGAGHGHPDRQSAGCSPVMSMSTVPYWNQLSAANDGQWRWVGGLEGTVQAFILGLDAIPAPSPGSPASCPAPTQASSAPPCTTSPRRCSSSGAVFTTRPSGFGWRRDTLALGPCQGLGRLPESLYWKTSLSPTINKEA